ncbi:EAL domain-containing protein, partial [Massilia arenosa]
LLGTGSGGIVLFKPVNQADPGAAWSAMIGLGVEASRLVGQALRQAALTEGVATSFLDTTGPAPVALQQGIAAGYSGEDYRRELRFGGRTYELRFAPTTPWQRQNVGWESWTVLACGLLLTALMGGLMLVVSGEQAQIRAQVDESTARLREREARLDAILNHASEAIMPVTLDGTVVACNAAAARMFGYSEEAVEGMRFERLVRVGPDGAAQTLASMAEAGEPSTEHLGCHAQGTSFPMFLSVAKVATPDDVFFVCMMHDLTEQYRSRERIHRLAHNDPLTGLENRFSLNQRLDQLLAQARRSGETVGLLFIDLDHFKKINDSFGHAAGDQFLVTVAARLKELLREGDTIARLGGDEFIVVTSGQLGPENLAVVAERIVQSLSAPYEVAATTVHSGASVGVALYPQDGADAGALLRSADTAMYAAKASGRGNFQFFSAAMNAAAHERLQLESQLWKALDNDEFELWLQPQIDLASGRVIGAEALLRWRHPERGLVPPDRFIPIAEDTGIIVPLGEWVLKRAADIVLRWRAQGLDHLRMAINLSARQCTGAGPLPLLDQILAATGISPSCLELEITESAAMQDPEHTRMLIDGMRARGTHVAIDDFGTGYSSLSYLKLFDIDRIKIDRGFVKDIETDPNDAAIVTATIGLAHALGLRVVAEGVETEAQRAYLRREGCDEAQGYLFARPLPEPEFLAWVLARLDTTGAESHTWPE